MTRPLLPMAAAVLLTFSWLFMGGCARQTSAGAGGATGTRTGVDSKRLEGAAMPDHAKASTADRSAILAVVDDETVPVDAQAAEESVPEGEAADPDAETEAQMWEVIEETFGRKGEVKDGVYRLVTPRSDLFVTMDGMDVPAGAFLESDFRFWRCPCGKLLVNGQFALADYEVNDVVDELHKGRLHVVTIAPLLLHEHPRLLMVRFQAEGRTKAITAALKSALSYTGDERNAPQPANLSPRTAD